MRTLSAGALAALSAPVVRLVTLVQMTFPGPVVVALNSSNRDFDFAGVTFRGAVVQGSPVVVRTALLDDALQVVDAPVEWAGRLDTMVIEEDGETCRVGVTAEASAVDLLRGSALTYSNADQQSLYPGDRAFEYIVAQSNTPVVWPSKEWLRALGPR